MGVRPQDIPGFDESGDHAPFIEMAANWALDNCIHWDRPFRPQRTIKLPPNTTIEGVNEDRSRLIRAGDYGHTFEVGDDQFAAGSFRVENLWVMVDRVVSNSNPALANKMTHGAHFKVRGGQKCDFDNVTAWGMPFAFDFSGSTVVNLDGVTTEQYWDPLNQGWQEGVAAIRFDKDAKYGPCKDLKVTGESVIGGWTSDLTEVAYPNGQTRTHFRNIGPLDGILIHSGETVDIDCSNIGGQASRGIAIRPTDVVANVTIAPRFMDSSGDTSILIERQVQEYWAEGVKIRTAANGQMIGKGLLEIPEWNGEPAVFMLDVKASARSHIMSPFRLFGVRGLNLVASPSNYNCQRVMDHDLQWSTGAVIGPNVTCGSVHGGCYGGGGNVLGTVNGCKAGIWNLAGSNVKIATDTIAEAPFGVPGGGLVV